MATATNGFDRIAAWVIDKLRTRGTMNKRQLSHAISSRDRPLLADVLNDLERDGRITHNRTTGWVLMSGTPSNVPTIFATTTAATLVPR